MCFITGQSSGVFMVTFGFFNHKISLAYLATLPHLLSCKFYNYQLQYRSCIHSTLSHNTTFFIQPGSISTLALIRNMSSDKNGSMILLIKSNSHHFFLIVFNYKYHGLINESMILLIKIVSQDCLPWRSIVFKEAVKLQTTDCKS